MTGLRDDLKEEALDLHKELQKYDEVTLNGIITAAYERENVQEAETVLEKAYQLYRATSDLGQRSIITSEEADEELTGQEFPIEWGSFSEFHADFEHALMRYIGIVEEVDDGRYDAVEDMLEDVESPEWLDTSDLEGSEILD